jgi:hypothetical protein
MHLMVYINNCYFFIYLFSNLGAYFTSLIMANGNQSYETDCILNEISTEVGFGCAQSQPIDDTQQQQWIGVAHYYPYRQLTTVQS